MRSLTDRRAMLAGDGKLVGCTQPAEVHALQRAVPAADGRPPALSAQ